MKVNSELESKPEKKSGKSRRVRYSDEDRRRRLEELRENTGQRLATYATSHIDPRSVSGNIENFIGTINFPIGIVGPLKIDYSNSVFSEGILNTQIDDKTKVQTEVRTSVQAKAQAKMEMDEVYAPLATTEGALISSAQRGCFAINLSGGIKTRVLSNKMIRAPQFEFNSIDAALVFCDWLKNLIQQLKNLVKNRSQYAQLIDLSTHCIGRTVHVRFVYETGNAAGQNMTTFCTSYLCQWILNEFRRDQNISHQLKLSSVSPKSSQFSSYECIDYIIEGNLSSDKKASYISAYEGRGRSVIAETIIKKSVLKRVLKLSVDELIHRFSRSKSARIFSGQIGFNINVANMVAGLFLSTGQDAACIHESSVAELHLEPKGDDLYASLYMPCLIVGTVGGGTHLPCFRDNLAMMNCLEGNNSADRLAETICSFALALELSTVSAVAGGQFVEAHHNGARKATLPSLKTSDLNEEFFKKSLHDKNILKVQEIKAENKQGYITDIAMQVSKKNTGVFAYQIESRNEVNNLVTKNAFLKLKAHEREVVLGSAKILQVLNPGLAEVIIKKKEFLPFKDSHIREIEILSNEKSVIPSISPRFLGSFIDQEKETFILIQELIDSGFSVSEVQNIDLWTEEIKKNTIINISMLHKEYLNQKEKAFLVSDHLIEFSNLEKMEHQLELWDSLFTLSYSKTKLLYPNLFNFYDKSLQKFESIMTELSLMPHSLIHFDFNPRNIAFNQSTRQVLFFDYEFAAWGPPQRDLVEFLLFTSNPNQIVEDFKYWSELHYNLLESSSISLKEWQLSLKMVTQEFIVRRLPFYYILSEFSFCNYIDRLLENLEELAKVHD